MFFGCYARKTLLPRIGQKQFLIYLAISAQVRRSLCDRRLKREALPIGSETER